MPFYEYECQACKYYTEVMQKVTDPPLTRCPSCGKRRLKKLVSAPVFRLKGGGWYETDFKSDKESKRNLLAAEKEETRPESKPEPEAKPAKPEGQEPQASAPQAAQSKSAEAQASSAAASASTGRSRVSIPAKAARTGAARRPARGARARGARRGRR
jgi:putative FmdB family regulatory protein